MVNISLLTPQKHREFCRIKLSLNLGCMIKCDGVLICDLVTQNIRTEISSHGPTKSKLH